MSPLVRPVADRFTVNDRLRKHVKNGPQTVTLTNVSSTAISITKIAAASPFSETDNCLGSLAAGATCQVSVYLTPTDPGSINGALSVTFSGSGSPEVISLTGTAVTYLDLSPSPVVFAKQQVGVPSPWTFLSVGDGMGGPTITLNSITVQGSEFAIAQNPCPPQLPPFVGCALQLVFTPSQTGLRTGSVTINASDYSQPHVIPLQGVGIGAGLLSLSASVLDFGVQKVGGTSQPQTITLTNTGTASVNFSSIVSSPSFFPITNACGTTLQVGASCSVSVQFAPTLKGVVTGLVTINDDSAGNPHSVTVTGIGN